MSGSIDGIQRFSATGSYLGTITWAQQSPPDPNSPGPIAVDSAGHIWVLDWSTRHVLKLDSSGTILASFGGDGFSAVDGTFSSPMDLAVSDDGLTVYVVDYSTGLVKKFVSTDGTTYPFVGASQPSTGSGSADGQLSAAGSIELDPVTGDVLVADTGNNRIQRFDSSDLSYKSKFGTYGFGADNLINPVGLAFDQWGNLWLGDPGSDRLKRIGEAPVVTLDSAPAITTAGSIVINYTQTDPGADCDVASGASVPLSIGSNTIVVTCTNDQGQGSDSLTIDRGNAPVVTISSPADNSSTTNSSASVAWTTAGTDPVSCTLNGAPATSPATANLALGANSITVSCTNAFGSDSRSVTVARTAPVVAPPGVKAVALKLPKKFKLTKSRKLKFSVTCPDGCTVTPKLMFGKKSSKLKIVRKAAGASPQTVTITLSKKMGSKAKAWMVNNRSVYLNVTVQSYKATQGKTGKAKLAR